MANIGEMSRAASSSQTSGPVEDELCVDVGSKAQWLLGIDILPMSGVRPRIEDRQHFGVTGQFGSRALQKRRGRQIWRSYSANVTINVLFIEQ